MSRRKFFDNEASAPRLPDRVCADAGEVLEYTLLSNRSVVQSATNSVEVSVDGPRVQELDIGAHHLSRMPAQRGNDLVVTEFGARGEGHTCGPIIDSVERWRGCDDSGWIVAIRKQSLTNDLLSLVKMSSAPEKRVIPSYEPLNRKCELNQESSPTPGWSLPAICDQG